MLFNSYSFWLFFVLVMALYAPLRRRPQNMLLLAASYFFYGCWDWRFLSLILLSTVTDYVCGLRIGSAATAAARRRYVWLSVGVNLGILGVFKYFDFFQQSLQQLLSQFGVELSIIDWQIVLPVGISFYTFQTMSYTIDVYRGTIEPERDPLNFSLYVAFFPQLVAGPIERASTLLPQIANPRQLSWRRLGEGLELAAWGLFKKIAIADTAAVVVEQAFAGPTYGAFSTLVGAYAFAVQIYCDFSGYTDIARGVARCLGFDLRLNFNLPYFARSPSDFWQRWHISLSSWLRDYLYIPLGGNRLGSTRTLVNLLATMLIGGLWHGAAWNFVFWGGYHGMLLVLYRWLAPRPNTSGSVAGWSLVPAIQIVVMFHLTCLGWLFFRASSAEQIGAMLTSLFTLAPTTDTMDGLPALLWGAGVLLAVQLWQAYRADLLALFRLPLAIRALAYTVLLYSCYFLARGATQQFIYFQF